MCGWQPWHCVAQSVSSLNLLDIQPRYPVAWVDILASNHNETLWEETLAPLLHILEGIHKAAHKLVAYPAIVVDTHESKRFSSFLEWWMNWLGDKVNAQNGLWCFQEKYFPPQTTCIGGSFAILSVFEAANRTVPLREKAVDTVLAMQHSNGLWSSATGVASWIDLDALYLATRSSRMANGYRWTDVSNAARRVVANIATTLNDPTTLLTHITDTHHLLPLLATVAEVQKWWPDAVITETPWLQSLDRSAFI
mmetsp:Transcript_66307/g.156598  ORF Transcript_66307/g.156598 Transcript_66307/m.156598 type:complete len:252 (+) Transcript_66307:95-850(+)